MRRELRRVRREVHIAPTALGGGIDQLSRLQKTGAPDLVHL